MMLWSHWWGLVCQLRSACARERTFLWMAVCLAGMTVRTELLGVTSTIRGLGLEPACYDRLLDFFHSPALDLSRLTCIWCVSGLQNPPQHRVLQWQGCSSRRRSQGCQGGTEDARCQ